MAITKEMITKFLLGQFEGSLSIFIEEKMENNPNITDTELILGLTEYSRELINEEVQVISEGFISNMVYLVDRENLIDFEHILSYLKDSKPSPISANEISNEQITRYLLEQFKNKLSNFISESFDAEPELSDEHRICEISEYTENTLIYEDLSNFNEGYVSDLINSIINTGSINYEYILEYLREDKD